MQVPVYYLLLLKHTVFIKTLTASRRRRRFHVLTRTGDQMSVSVLDLTSLNAALQSLNEA